ncbi:uncharacterized protein LOC126278701 [Schistocerca gregaria]|uniref:uncharacterized protein LOC126278701 n=1 Tax=Schistocerca gregaria TaxID=7010 RepID=UPI00211EEC88|nr:uncharacterized protein LOC126278701 [Schistocerca gregaria]
MFCHKSPLSLASRKSVRVEDIYEPVWFAYQLMESFLLLIYTNKTGLNSDTQSRSSETAGEEIIDEAKETENYNSVAGSSTPASTVSSPSTSKSKEKPHRRTASNIAEQQMATAFGQLTNIFSQCP